MKINILLLFMVLTFIMFSACGGATKIEPAKTTDTITNAALNLDDQAYQVSRREFVKVVRDIPFNIKSSEVKLNDPKYVIEGTNIDTFMKKIIIPALSKLVNVLPSDKKVVIDGNASRTGTDEASSDFIGNKELSKARAEAVLDYILKNSSLDRSKFTIRANGSTKQIPGTLPEDPRNCRVSFDIE